MALYSIGTPMIDGLPFAVVADDTTAHYVYPDGFGRGAAGDDRILRLLEIYEVEAPTTAADWVSLASSGFGMYGFGEPLEVESLDAAIAAAEAELSTLTGASPRDLFLSDLAEAHARHVENSAPVTNPDEAKSRDYSMWSQDINPNPEDELVFQLEVMGEVDPKQPHRWLPFKLDEPECAFCDLLEDAEIHARL